MAENKYISELSGNTNPSLTGYTVYDDGLSTYKVTLQTLKDKLFSTSASYATLSGNTFQGTQIINGDLIVTGSITAQQYVVSSSVYHIVESTISGSSNFGNSLDDTHIFTGSMKISGSVTASYFVGDGSQLTNLPLSHLSTTTSLNSVSNSVNDLISHTSSYLTSLPTGVISGSLQITDLGYAITGSNTFFGNQTIRGTVIIGTGSLHSGEPEVLSVANSGSFNIAYFTGESDTYSQINIQNISDNSGASTDLVLTADNGSETNHYVNLGINSSGWAFQTASIGFQNDGYLYNVGQDMYIGVMDPASSDHGHLHLFSEGLWYQPSISLLESGSVGFNTGSVTTGFTYEFSGSVKLNNELSVSSIKNLNGDLNLSTNGDTVFVIGSNFSVPNGGISSGFNVTAPIISGSSLTGSLDWINLINVPSLISGSSQINYSGITGIPNGIISGSEQLPSGLVSGSSQISYTGITDIPSGLVSGSSQVLDGSGVWSGSSQLPLGLVSGSSQILENSGIWSGSAQLPSNIISGSSQITNLGFAITGSNNFIGDQTINGSLIIEGVSEILTVDGGFSGNRSFDYTSGSIFYLTGLTGNGTWNIDNVPTTNNRGLTMTFVIEQGVTTFSGSAYSFDSTPVTVKWADSTVPTGSANKTEVIGLTAFRVGSSWNVLGSLSTFGI
jgi:hypothetical protein